jgi:hypothetical protein
MQRKIKTGSKGPFCGIFSRPKINQLWFDGIDVLLQVIWANWHSL